VASGGRMLPRMTSGCHGLHRGGLLLPQGVAGGLGGQKWPWGLQMALWVYRWPRGLRVVLWGHGWLLGVASGLRGMQLRRVEGDINYMSIFYKCPGKAIESSRIAFFV
jgi:hypothetical protein